MKRLIGLLIFGGVLAVVVNHVRTQADPNPERDLVSSQVETVTRPDIFGGETLYAEGILTNRAGVAYSSISLYAELYNADDELVGEGFGYLVNACGTGLLDLVLHPDDQQAFSVALEPYANDVEFTRVEIIPDATTTDATPGDELSFPDVRRLSDREVVNVEWVDDQTMLYGVGCDSDVFSNLKWYQVTVDQGISFPVDHPKAVNITEAMLRQVGLTDPVLFNRSFLSFHPTDTRMVYQTDLNSVITAERDGSFKRIIYDDLSRVSLHGFLWLPEGRFLAYYYGAYGDPVLYYTANLAGQRISTPVYESVPSQTIPGATNDGGRVIIGTTINDKTGYFLTSTQTGSSAFLFDSELPGNNYPAPVLIPQEGGNYHAYIARLVDGQAHLDCFDLESKELHAITPLPLNLTTDDRAWFWLSPDRSTLALSANGQSSGLWIVDIADKSC